MTNPPATSAYCDLDPFSIDAAAHGFTFYPHGADRLEALVALGYTNAEAVKAVKSANVTEEMDSEAVLKASLKYLAFL